MTDEANVHYFAMIDQLIEGHQWLERNLGTRPIKNAFLMEAFFFLRVDKRMLNSLSSFKSNLSRKLNKSDLINPNSVDIGSLTR